MNNARRETVAEINLDNLRHNVREVRKKTGKTKIIAEVKANAYGHGLLPVSRTLEDEGVDYFGVALLEEAVSLRKTGTKKPVLIQACVNPSAAEDIVMHNLTVSLSEMETARALSAAAKKLNRKAVVHIKVDTGLHRFGRLPEDIPDFVRQVNSLEGIYMEGIYSHLASSVLSNREYTMMQFNSFLGVLGEMERRGYSFPLRHIACSSTVFELPESHLDIVRVGTAFYGTRDMEGADLKPVLSLKSRVCFVKKVPAGSFISYRMAYRTEKEANIAVMNIGYADGLPRALSNKGDVLIRGKRFPMAGIIAMDNTMIDLGREDVSVGEEIVIIGKQGKEQITIAELADKLDTSSGEIPARISGRVPRVYVEQGKDKSFGQGEQ